MSERVGSFSLNEDAKSPFWFVSFIGPDGSQKRRSTKVPVAGGLFKGERLSAAQAKKRALLVGAEIVKSVCSEFEAHDNRSVRDFLAEYVLRSQRRLREQSLRNMRRACDLFALWLGKRADQPLRSVTRLDVKMFTESRCAEVRASTVSRDLGCLRTAFEDAVDSEILPRNPFRNVRVPRTAGESELKRQAFSLDELRFLIAHLPDEWSSAVRCCFETFGQRLGDILTLRWSQFDWEQRVVRFVTQKTGRTLAQPMRHAFYSWARARWEAAGCPQDALLHPHLARLSTPSQEFTNLLRAFGIGEDTLPQGGRRRRLHSKSFHSIRASAATLLQASGVAQGVAMKLVGHASEAIHEMYVKPDAELLRSAAEQLPEL